MKIGHDIFGKAYGVMLRNDLHTQNSIDHKLMQEMVLLDEESYPVLYGIRPQEKDMRGHELFQFARQFQGESSRHTVENILHYCAGIADSFSVPFEEMQFGGTEKEILDRGTDWCADMARVGAVLLMCNGIPARLVHLVNPRLAYNGHVVVEAFYEGKYGVCDFIYGYCFYDEKPLDVYNLMQYKQHLAQYSEDYAGLYCAAAVSEYDPLGENCYGISTPNEYYLRLINTDHKGKWLMGEDGA